MLLPLGVEDGQTVRMPVGKKEIFITFKVNAMMCWLLSALLRQETNQPLHCHNWISLDCLVCGTVWALWLVVKQFRHVSFYNYRRSNTLVDCDVFWVCVQVQKSPVFRRDGADLHSDLYVSVAQAVLGGTARTQGLYETLNLSVSRLRHPQATSQHRHTHTVLKTLIIPSLRSLQESRRTRGSVWQEKVSLASVATALETITSTSK